MFSLTFSPVLTTDEYDKQHRDNAEVGPQPGVRVVTNKPPNTQGIIRPRRTPEKGMLYYIRCLL